MAVALLFAVVIGFLMLGFPVAFSLAGAALLFAAAAWAAGVFDPAILGAIPSRLYGVMNNETLIAVPMFVLMGTLLERGKISEDLLEAMGRAFGNLRGGLAVSVCVVGAILAASTGIVGATVVTMGLISLPVMLRHRYRPAFACGVITASGTLGQIIPPSIVLVILGDVIGNANQQAQLALGNFSPDAVSVGDLFFGALLPGLLLVGMYIVYVLLAAFFRPEWAGAGSAAASPAAPSEKKTAGGGGDGGGAVDGGGKRLITVLWMPVFLIIAVLGSILAGIATPTEAAAVGAGGAFFLCRLKGSLSGAALQGALSSATRITCMVFAIFIGANIFSLVFRGVGGDETVGEILANLPGGALGAFVAVMLLVFILGFFLDFIEIVFVVVPIVAPALIMLGLDPLWLGVMFAVNLQTSFLTPPFGFALFYLRGVAPPAVRAADIYKGAPPFIALQLLLMALLWFFPDLVTWLPQHIYR